MENSNKKKWAPVLAIVVAIIGVILFFIGINGPQNTIELDRIISEIRYEEDRAYINFSDDEVDYVFYEFEDVTVECLKTLHSGDAVTITVMDNYKNFTYAIVREMVFEGEVLFNSLANDKQHDENVLIVFETAILASLLTALMLVLWKAPAREKISRSFEIKNPRWQLYAFTIMGIAGTAAFLAFCLLRLIGRMDRETFTVSYVFLFFSVLGAVGIYVYIKEKFTLKDGVYFYSKPFLKSQTARAVDIHYLKIETTGKLLKVELFDKEGRKLINFLDDGTAFKSGEFIESLAYYKIPIKQTVFKISFGELREFLMEQMEVVDKAEISFWLDKQEYVISFYKERCEFYKCGLEKKDVLNFKSLDELYASESFAGMILKDEWERIERFEYLDFPAFTK